MAPRTKDYQPGLARTRSVVAALALTGAVSLDMAARRLGTSPRTLQRRLNRGGTNFWALVDQSRFEIAGALLGETDLKIREIAARIGYCNPNAFTRAFTRWAGCTPSAYRRARTGRQLVTQVWREKGRPASRRSVALKGFTDLSEET
jgi:AraC-like DNA-binding protein